MKHLQHLIITVGIIAVLTGCTKITKLEQDGWELRVNPGTNTIEFSHKTLDDVLKKAQLGIKQKDTVKLLTAWNVKKENGKLIIQTTLPSETSWEFKVVNSTVDISCSNENAVLVGLAPAGEDRIPARIESQDNGIMRTQMGLVSATDIYNLFDMKTEIMIQFPKASSLTRNISDRTFMDVVIPVNKDNDLKLIEEYYTDVIGLEDYQKTDFKPEYKPIPDRFESAATGWSTWYCYYMAPTQKDLNQETDALAEKLKPYGLEYVHIDAAYTKGKDANWLEWNKESFPEGGKAWFEHIKEQGLKPGLWLNIYGANYANPSMADSYPEEYFLRDTNGNLDQACCTADSTVVKLDYTNPEVIENHLKPLFKTLVNDWGLTYLKDAGWGRWMDYYEENRANAMNPDMDSRVVYRKAQEAVRDVLGKDKYITGCAMHEVGVGFGYFDGARTGPDDYASWTGEGHWSGGMQAYFQSLFGANYLNGICWFSDPDDVMIRDPLTLDEGKTIVSAISLTGQNYIISDFIAEFSPERLKNFINSDNRTGWAEQYPDLVKGLGPEKIELYQETMPTMPIKAMDLYPFRSEPICCPKPDEYPRALDLKVNAESGTYDVVALYNWDDNKSLQSLNLHKDLGLKANKTYLAFDFWNKSFFGKIKDSIETEIPTHGTKALIIKEAANKPQLMATSRHLTMAQSIKKMDWNENNATLSGTAETISGDTYSLFIHVPKNYTFKSFNTKAANPKHKVNSNGILQVSFDGIEKPADWEIDFSKQ